MLEGQPDDIVKVVRNAMTLISSLRDTRSKSLDTESSFYIKLYHEIVLISQKSRPRSRNALDIECEIFSQKYNKMCTEYEYPHSTKGMLSALSSCQQLSGPGSDIIIKAIL